MATVISHFYNEEYLLPFWLKQHRDIFAHGILIDYASTDQSVDICHDLVPNWEIRKSAFEFFRAADCDAEVIDIERSITGWKCALTATEFVYGDAERAITALEQEGCLAARLRPVAMVDLQERSSVDPDIPLDAQCHTGYMDGWIAPYKSRLLHRHADGAYSIGRHSSSHQSVKMHPEELLLKWYGFAPWTQALRDRKMQIQTRMPSDEVDVGHGIQHILDKDKLDAMWRNEVAISGDLREYPDYF